MNNISKSDQITPKIRSVQINTLNKKGLGKGQSDTGGTLTVPYTIPGELVEAERLRRKDARLLKVIEPSPHRIDPVCQHYGQCGGCVWQHIDYQHQLELKRARVAQRFNDAGLPIDEESIQIESEKDFEYRNRMDFIWWYDGKFGLRQRGKWYSIVDLHECHLLPKSVMDIALQVNQRVQESGLPFRDGKKKKRGLRYLIIRNGIFTEDIMLSFVSDDMEIPSSLYEGLENVTSVYQLINDNLENDQSDGRPIHLWGEKYYREKIGRHIFQIGPRSFFQPNPAVAVKMVDYVKHITSELKDKNNLIDLYCGIGLFSITLADTFDKVLAIENNPEAIRIAEENNNNTSIEFSCMDAEKIEWPNRGEYKTILIDPPRTGLHPQVIKELRNEPFTDLIYVSCNPNKGVEDIAELQEKYQINSVKLFDQFPQTAHVEMIAHLKA